MRKVGKILLSLGLAVLMVFSGQYVSGTTNNSDYVSAATKIKINKKKATIYVGKTVQLKVKGTKKKVTWKSSNKKIATVTSKGKVKGVANGSATITAKLGKKSYTCKVTVKVRNITKPVLTNENLVIPVEYIILDKNQIEINVGENAILNATVFPDNASSKDVTWISSNPTIATVKDGVVSAVSSGAVSIIASAGDKTVSCPVTVLPPYSVSIKNALSIDASYDKIEISVTNNGISYICLGNYSDLEKKYMSVHNVLAGSRIYQSNETGYCLLPATMIAPGETKIISLGYLYTTTLGFRYYSTYHLSSSSYFKIPIYELYNGTSTLHIETCYVSQ